VPLEKIREYIDWTPFFSTWELKGKYPEIFLNENYGTEAKKIFDDANILLDKIIKENLLIAKGTIGIFPANSVNDDIEIYGDIDRELIIGVLHTIRQQIKKAKGET
jgi:5-methyltetrahydrofolate--homocysteine methyltransferase